MYMHSTLFSMTFPRFLKCPKNNQVGTNFSGCVCAGGRAAGGEGVGKFCTAAKLFGRCFSFFKLNNLMDQNSLSFIRF